MDNKIKMPSVIVGELVFTDMMGNPGQTPKNISFNQADGAAVTVLSSPIYGTMCMPVYKANGERFVMPGYNGIKCEYNDKTGCLENFEEER